MAEYIHSPNFLVTGFDLAVCQALTPPKSLLYGISYINDQVKVVNIAVLSLALIKQCMHCIREVMYKWSDILTIMI